MASMHWHRIQKLYVCTVWKVDEKAWIFRIELKLSFYDKVDKVDRFSNDFGGITVPFKVRRQSNAEVYDWEY